MEAVFPYAVGQIVEFQYPIHNTVHECHEGAQWRVIEVLGVRDLEQEPLEPITLELHPERRRDRFLVMGMDLAKQDIRLFYFSSMVNHHAAAPGEERLRLALYDPCEPGDDHEFIGPTFQDTPDDKFIMRMAMNQYNQQASAEGHTLVMAPFPWRISA